MSSEGDIIKRRQNFSQKTKRGTDNAVARNANNSNHDIWLSLRSFINLTFTRFHDQPLAAIECDVHDIWYRFFKAATITAWNHPAQDRLVAEILRARELGSVGTGAVTPDGAIWTGLPFLVTDFQRLGSAEMRILMAREEICNVAAFTAKLVAAGVRAAELCVVGCEVLRSALEEPERGIGTEGPDMLTTSFSKLLPAAVVWVRVGGHRLAMLSKSSVVQPPMQHDTETIVDAMAVGSLAREAGIKPGFSRSRWVFWLQRFRTLTEESRDSKVRELARRGMNASGVWSRFTGLLAEDEIPAFKESDPAEESYARSLDWGSTLAGETDAQ